MAEIVPRKDLLISDGLWDFIVHKVTSESIYGARYPSLERGDVQNAELIRIPHQTWEQAQEKVSEVVDLSEEK